MSAVSVQELFEVTQTTYEVLQELQISLGVESHGMPARALEATIVWYDDATSLGRAMSFVPPKNQETWRAYTRSLAIEPEPLPAGEENLPLLVEGEAQRRLAASNELLRLATGGGLERMVRLRAEEVLRRADSWTVEIELEDGAKP